MLISDGYKTTEKEFPKLFRNCIHTLETNEQTKPTKEQQKITFKEKTYLFAMESITEFCCSQNTE